MNSVSYIQLILPLKLAWEPWYSTTEPLTIGQRVYARMAGSLYVAVVHRISDRPGIEVDKVRPIQSAVSDLAPVSANELKLWEFLSSYYLCSIGEVYKAAYPAVKTRGETDAVLTVKRLESLIDAKRKLISEMEAKKRPNRKLISLHEDILGRHLRMLESLSVKDRVQEPSRDMPHPVPLLSVRADNVSVYVQAIRNTLQGGNSALVLVPQISASDNMHKHLSREFRSNLVVHNSNMTTAKRRDLMHLLRYSDEPLVMLGTRSSIFLPFHRLSLVIVDSEQSPLFKQSEPSPRYNARDAAAMLASIHGASLILGTTCPSMESLFNTVCGKYKLEYQAVRSQVEIIDMSAEKRKRGVDGALSYKLLEALRSSQGSRLLVRGYETEEQLRSQLEALNLVCDVMTPLAACSADRRFDMIALLSADALFSADDFRSDEKALQVLKTLSARCSCLYVQTTNASHPVFSLLQSPDLPYRLLDERREFKLPPYTRLVDIKGPKGNLYKRVVLERGSALAFEKHRLYSQYSATNIIDVDPL